MPKRLKFVVEQWVLSMVRRQTWQARQFAISNRLVAFESNRDVRFEFESNLEASQVPSLRSFAVSAPTCWNSLSLQLKSASLTLQQFCDRLKTVLFSRSYGWPLQSWLLRRVAWSQTDTVTGFDSSSKLSKLWRTRQTRHCRNIIMAMSC